MKEEIKKQIRNLLDSNKIKKAIEYINSISKEELDSEINYLLSKAYLDIDDNDNAIKTLKFIENEEANTAVWNYRMGFAHYNNSDYDEALKYFLRAYKINPAYEGLNTFLVWTYLMLADREANDEKNNYLLSFEHTNNALKYAKLVLEIEGDENIYEDLIDIYKKLAWLCERLNNYEMAIDYLNLSLEIEEESEWTFSEMGHCLRKLERYEEALKYFDKALELSRKDTWIYSEIGLTYHLRGENEIALEYMLKAKELSPLKKDEFLENKISNILNEIEKNKGTRIEK